MAEVDPAIQTMIDNLPARTGRGLAEWTALLAPLGLSRHGEIVKYLKAEHGVTHGFANLIATRHLAGDTPAAADDLVQAQYAGREQLRPLYEQVVSLVSEFGDDVEIAPKKTYVALRRGKQFAMVGPGSRTRLDVGLNLKGEPPTERLRPATGMCTHKIAVTTAGDVDDDLRTLLRKAYDRA
jgi:hypothetical protein